MDRVAVVTNIPTPYRNPVFSLLARSGIELKVIFCAKTEPNRKWENLPMEFEHVFLHGRCYAKKDGFNFIHNNPDVWKELERFMPDVVVTTGFNPTHIYAFLWAKRHRVKHVVMTDGSVTSERKLGYVHKGLRKLFYWGSHAFVAASKAGLKIFKNYGVPETSCFLSCLPVDIGLYAKYADNLTKPYDLLFVGMLHERKMPLFFAQVAGELKKHIPALQVLLIGDGPQREAVVTALHNSEVNFYYAGFVQPSDLPRFYSIAKILLFPTRHDPWGLVAGEGMAAGLPVICSPEAGIAGELVVHGDTGLVLELSVSAWVEGARKLLDNESLLHAFSERARLRIKDYSINNAAIGLREACAFALGA